MLLDRGIAASTYRFREGPKHLSGASRFCDIEGRKDVVGAELAGKALAEPGRALVLEQQVSCILIEHCRPWVDTGLDGVGSEQHAAEAVDGQASQAVQVFAGLLEVGALLGRRLPVGERGPQILRHPSGQKLINKAHDALAQFGCRELGEADGRYG